MEQEFWLQEQHLWFDSDLFSNSLKDMPTFLFVKIVEIPCICHNRILLFSKPLSLHILGFSSMLATGYKVKWQAMGFGKNEEQQETSGFVWFLWRVKSVLAR